MSFYSSISKVYDDIFPLNPVRLEFVEKCLNGSVAGKRIIDAGCGTGSLAIMLARRSARGRGFDADEKMIELAEKKRPQALDLRFKTGDLVRELTEFEENRYDAVLCFGNTLVHLTTKNKLERFIKRSSQILKRKGNLLLQIVNYDRILERKIDILPTIEKDVLKFVRKYHFEADGLISFETILTEKASGKQIKNKIKLYPLKKEGIDNLLKKYFSEVSYFGDYKMNPLTGDSFHLIVKAEK